MLGRAYLDAKSPSLAVAAFDKALETVKNDAIALHGLAEAYLALGEKEKAESVYGRLLYVWADADKGLLKPLPLNATPRDNSPAEQRNYLRTSLERLGPNTWEPYPAPKLDATDSKGKRVTLEEYAGKNVLLIFFLGEECAHCLEQLNSITKRKADFQQRGVELLAISSASQEKNATSEKLGELALRLLSDKNFENAHRFQSYDDFEGIELHSTILIDKQGRVHWARQGGTPFTDIDFLLKEIPRMNQPVPGQQTAAGGGQ